MRSPGGSYGKKVGMIWMVVVRLFQARGEDVLLLGLLFQVGVLNMASISYFATARRSACDRCKKQKLRCPPEPHHKTGQPCGRCVRADVPCVRGYTRPRGYSARTAGGHISLPESFSAAPGPPLETAEPHLLQRSTDVMLDLYEASTDAAGFSWTFSNDDDSQYLMPSSHHNTEASTTRSDGNNIPAASFDDHLFSEDFHDGSIESFKTASGASTITHQVPSDSVGGTPETHRQRPSTGSSSTHIWPLPQWTECDMRLCQLSLDLCRQLEKQIHTPPDGMSGAQGGMTCPVGSGTSGDVFKDALNSTEEFIGILQDIQGGMPSTASSSSTTTSRTSSLGSLGETRTLSRLVCIQALESCYLRIVNLFNLHLASMHGQSCQEGDDPNTDPSPLTSPLASRSPPVLPGLHLAGFLVRQAGLQAKILCQVIQYQFETIERLLDLPSRLRVSGCTDEGEESTGALCELWVSNSVKGGGAECDELRAIQMLRERISDTRQ